MKEGNKAAAGNEESKDFASTCEKLEIKISDSLSLTKPTQEQAMKNSNNEFEKTSNRHEEQIEANGAKLVQSNPRTFP